MVGIILKSDWNVINYLEIKGIYSEKVKNDEVTLENHF